MLSERKRFEAETTATQTKQAVKNERHFINLRLKKKYEDGDSSCSESSMAAFLLAILSLFILAKYSTIHPYEHQAQWEENISLVLLPNFFFFYRQINSTRIVAPSNTIRERKGVKLKISYNNTETKEE
ncbi:hypothetical protein CEXT_768741 [Caerostris extrusa]|uniref:Uncharacterized protein n=1 Tax=Caerostris extrusa TaxID=172846 RepID=A0AAV4PY77_CAEEX|nr:hypothetical protein CEXT_768741 [Caerostris extrusa]